MAVAGRCNAAGEALAAAQLLASRLGATADAGRIIKWLGPLGISEGRFSGGDKDYQKQAIMRLAQAAAAGSSGNLISAGPACIWFDGE